MIILDLDRNQHPAEQFQPKTLKPAKEMKLNPEMRSFRSWRDLSAEN